MSDYAYIYVYQTIRDQILHGAYPVNTYLHSKRTLSKEFMVSRITIEHALELLLEEGYITGEERVGYRVIYTEDSVFPSWTMPPSLQPGASVTDPPFPYTTYAKAVRTVLSACGESVLQKSEMQGNPVLRNAIKNYLARSRNLFVKENQIVIGGSSDIAYSRIVELFGRSTIYGIETPGFDTVEKCYKNQGVRIDQLHLGKNGILSSELERTPAKVLHVTPYASYPTLVSASASKRKEYLEWACKKEGWLVEDDYASEFLPAARGLHTIFSEDREGRVVYLNSFHKTLSPSLRMGYMVLPEQRAEQYLHRWEYHSCPVSTLDQLVVAEILNSGAFERNLNRLRRKKGKEHT